VIGEAVIAVSRADERVRGHAGSARREKARRLVVNLVLALFWMLIFEGSVRKWAAPQYSSYLYFVRDPVVVFAYLVALRAQLFTPVPPLMLVGGLIAALATALSVLALAAGDAQYTPVLALYGVRNYFLYLPLAFLVGRCFRYDDLRRLAKSAFVAMIIAAPIALLQFEASPTSILNVGISDDAQFQFGNLASGSGRVRPAGTFTSVMGMTQLTVSTVAWLLWVLNAQRRQRPVNAWLAMLALLAATSAIAVSGSRTTIIHSCLVLVATMVAAPFLRGSAPKMRALLFPVLAAAAFAVLFPIIFPTAFQTFMERWSDAQVTESQRFAFGWIGRSLYGFYDFTRLLGQVPLTGYGIGMAGNGAVNMGVKISGQSVLLLGEEDWTRHVIELGPVVAILFISYRVGFAVWLGRLAARAAVRSGNVLPVAMFTYVAVALVQGQLTGHGLVNGFGWLYIGVCIAACNVVRRAGAPPAASGPPAATRDGATAPDGAVGAGAGQRRFPNVLR
jgi:hypothetical protein